MVIAFANNLRIFFVAAVPYPSTKAAKTMITLCGSSHSTVCERLLKNPSLLLTVVTFADESAGIIVTMAIPAK